MVVFVLTVCALAVSCIITYQDFKDRQVYLFVFPLLFALLLGRSVTQIGLLSSVLLVGINTVLSLLLTVSCLLYFKIRYGAREKFFDEKIGMGDIYFLLAVTPLFSAFNYMFFIVSGLCLSLLIHSFITLVGRGQPLVPLAGYLSLFMGGLIVLEYFTGSFSLISDYKLLNLISCL